MTLPFRLPPPADRTGEPAWDGRRFRIGDDTVRVLEYSENFAGWSDDLTALHEDAAGDQHPMDVASRQDAIAQVRRCLPSPHAVILEIGCSSGFLLRQLRAEFPQATVIGADVVREPLHRLADALPGVPLLRFDLLRCPLPDACIDVLVMLNVLEHIEDDPCALRNALRVLRPGGTLVIEVPAGPRLYDAYDAELRHFRRYSADDLHRKLVDAGFEPVRQSHLGCLVFPAFAAVKLANRWLHRDARGRVARQAASTSDSRLMRWTMALESKFLAGRQLPFGIRLTCVARRPAPCP